MLSPAASGELFRFHKAILLMQGPEMTDNNGRGDSSLEPVKLVKFLGYTAAATLVVLAAVEDLFINSPLT